MNRDTAEVVVAEAALAAEEVVAGLLATEITERLLAEVSVEVDTAAEAEVTAVTAMVTAVGTVMAEDTDPVAAVDIAVVPITALPRDTAVEEEEGAVLPPAVGGKWDCTSPNGVFDRMG